MLIWTDMIVGNIKEDGVIEKDSVHPVHQIALGGYLHHHIPAALFHHLCEIFLQYIGFRSRIHGRKMVASNNRPICADQSCFFTCRFQDRLYHIGCRRFPLCSGYADRRHFSGRITKAGGRKQGQGISAVPDPKYCNFFGDCDRFLRYKHFCAFLNYIRDEFVGIHIGAPHADKYGTGSRFSGIVDDVIHLLVQIPLQELIFHFLKPFSQFHS